MLSIMPLSRLLFGQTLTLYLAIHEALNNNETILYNADQNYLSAQSQLNSVKAGYRLQSNLSLNSNHTYSRSMSNGSYLSYKSQNTASNLGLSYRFLTPAGSEASLGIIYLTQMHGADAFYNSPQITFLFKQPLSWSGIQSGHANVIKAQQEFISARISFQLQKEYLIISVIDSYFKLWQALRNIEQNQQDLESAKRVLDIAELRLVAGQISEFEVMNTRVQYRISEDNLKVAQNNLHTMRRSFLRLLGEDLNTEINLSKDIKLNTYNFDLASTIDIANKNRSEIRLSEINVHLAELDLKQMAATAYPTLYLSCNYSLSSKYNVSLSKAMSNWPNKYWSVQSTLSFPILDGGTRSSQLQIAANSCSIQYKNLQLLKQDVAIEIEECVRLLQLNLNRVESLSLSLQLAKDALSISELRFKQGEVSTTEIESIRQRYNNAQQMLNEAKISCITQSAQLAKAMGVLEEWVQQLKD